MIICRLFTYEMHKYCKIKKNNKKSHTHHSKMSYLNVLLNSTLCKEVKNSKAGRLYKTVIPSHTHTQDWLKKESRLKTLTLNEKESSSAFSKHQLTKPTPSPPFSSLSTVSSILSLFAPKPWSGHVSSMSQGFQIFMTSKRVVTRDSTAYAGPEARWQVDIHKHKH